MIIKREGYDPQHRLVTRWVPGVVAAERYYNEAHQADAVKTFFGGDQPAEEIILEQGEGVYLCNDEGKTIEVLSRLHHPVY